MDFQSKRNNLGQVDKYKAQLVAQGFSQVSGLDFNETFSPTIRFTSVRVLIYISFSFVRYDYVISAGIGFRVASGVVASP